MYLQTITSLFYKIIIISSSIIHNLFVPLHHNHGVKVELAKFMNDKIRHSGVIDSIEDNVVKVRILQTSACATCKVAVHCNASESKEKLVEVKVADDDVWQVGDAVMVCASRNVISRAMMLAFALPLGLMIATLVAVMVATGDEGTAGLLSIAVLVPYFLLVWLFREHVGRQISFSMES